MCLIFLSSQKVDFVLSYIYFLHLNLFSDKDGNASNRIEGRPDLSQHNSLSQGDGNFSPYAHVRENPYDKVRKVEHPYAVVQSTSSQEQGSSSEVTPRTAPLR